MPTLRRNLRAMDQLFGVAPRTRKIGPLQKDLHMTNEWIHVQPPQPMNPMSWRRAMRLMYPHRKRLPRPRDVARDLKREAQRVRNQLVFLAGSHLRRSYEEIELGAAIIRETGPVGGWRVSVPRSLRPLIGRWVTS